MLGLQAAKCKIYFCGTSCKKHYLPNNAINCCNFLHDYLKKTFTLQLVLAITVYIFHVYIRLKKLVHINAPFNSQLKISLRMSKPLFSLNLSASADLYILLIYSAYLPEKITVPEDLGIYLFLK